MAFSLPRLSAPSARRGFTAVAAISGLVIIATASLAFGTVRLVPSEVLQSLVSPADADAQAATVVWALRLPRAITAVLVGAALATAGAVMQAVLRNPLADPGITGVSAGAAVGAVGAIVLGIGGSTWGIPLSAFIGAAVVALVLQVVLSARPDLGPAGIILVGVTISALAGACISLLIANAHDDALARGAMFWLAGDLDLRTWQHVTLALGPVLVGTILLLMRARALDALALGDEVAATSGVHVRRERTVLLLVASLITGAAVAVSGIIGFVGLIVPHAVRLIVGTRHAALLPLSAVAGAAFLLVADTIARSAFGSVVVQTGVVCAAIGAPLFLAMLLRRRTA